MIKEYISKKYIRAYALIQVLLCLISLKPVYDSIGWVCLIIIVFTYIAAKAINANIFFIQEHIKNKKDMLLFVVAYLYTLFAFFGMVILEKEILDSFFFPAILYLPILLIWTFPLYIMCIKKMYDFVESCKIVKGQHMSTKMYMCLSALMLLNYVLWLYAFNPCISTPDSSDLYLQAHHMLDTPMKDWHPPFYVIMLRMLLKICDSVTFVVLIQCVYFILVYMSIIKYLYNKGVEKNIVVFIYILGGFAFNNTMQMVTLWKDIPYMISLMWLTIHCIKVTLDYDKYSKQISWYVGLGVSLIFTSLFRQNGVVPVFATIIILGIYMLHKRNIKYLFTIVVMISTFCFIKGPVYDYYNVERVNGLKYFALANDIVCLEETGCSLPKESMDIVRQVKTESENEVYSSPYYARYNDNAFEKYTMNKFIKGYVMAFAKHPLRLTKIILQRNAVIWGIFQAKREILGCANITGECVVDYYDYKYPYRVENQLTNILENISGLFTNLVEFITWKTGIYLLLIIYCFGYILKRRYAGKYFIMFIPIFGNIFSLIVGSGWPDYRYFWPTEMICYIIVVTVIYIICTEKAAVDSSNQPKKEKEIVKKQ